MLKYFSQADFDRCTPSCSIDAMSSRLLHFLDDMREYVGQPIIINSAYRSPEYEKSKGRSGTSSHCKGIAVDVRCCTNELRFKILKYIFLAKFSCGFCVRVGIASNYLHIDLDDSKRESVWVY